jgi:hypothetical protein
MKEPTITLDDRELLTWLIANDASFGTVGRLVEVRGHAPIWQDTRFVRRPCRYLYEWHCFDGTDERAAIRAAMEARPCSASSLHGCSQSRTIRDHGSETPLRLLEDRNRQLLAALYERSAVATSLRLAVQRRIDDAGLLTPESRAAFALRDLLDELLAPQEPAHV